MKKLPQNPTGPQIQNHVKEHVQDALDQREIDNQYQVSPIPYHIHNGTDSPIIDLKANPVTIPNNYFSIEYNNGGVTGTATINWALSNVQYVTLTGNTTFSFTNPNPGQRMLLQVAGAFTPTWPATVRWAGGVVPTPTASAGYKDIYAFTYSGIDNLYNGVPSTNFATT